VQRHQEGEIEGRDANAPQLPVDQLHVVASGIPRQHDVSGVHVAVDKRDPSEPDMPIEGRA
jgi:hypothetical protein